MERSGQEEGSGIVCHQPRPVTAIRSRATGLELAECDSVGADRTRGGTRHRYPPNARTHRLNSALVPRRSGPGRIPANRHPDGRGEFDSSVPSNSLFRRPPTWHVRGTFSLTGIVIAGTLGSWIGASAMSAFGRYAAADALRALCADHARRSSRRRPGQALRRHGRIRRANPARDPPLIGIPAGVVRIWKFSLATSVGSALWCTVLVWIGVTAGKDQALLQGSLHPSLCGAAVS